MNGKDKEEREGRGGHERRGEGEGGRVRPRCYIRCQGMPAPRSIENC